MPTNRDLRAQLAAAAARLQEVDSPALAAAVDTVLAPRGWAALRATDPDGTAGPNLSVMLDKAARDQIVAAAKAAGTSVTDDVNEGYRSFLAGEYTPRKPVRARYGASVERVNLNVTPVLSLRQQVEEQAGMSAANVAADFLMRKYKAGPYAAGYAADSLQPGAVCNPQVPRTVRDLIRSRAAAAGNKVTDDVNEGFQKYLDGEFTPEALVWADTSDMVNLRMNPNDDLHDKLRAVKGIRPLQVAVAFLLDKYDIDPGAAK
ncbi:hypothetical protein OHA04_45250 (plasmid) [Streptomyces sp. NBC_01590]|uniref:hypothetical protein n=1 Tax=Streptomyces sp. NBC_01590 TaxID=2975887 RepID=UPI0038669F66